LSDPKPEDIKEGMEYEQKVPLSPKWKPVLRAHSMISSVMNTLAASKNVQNLMIRQDVQRVFNGPNMTRGYDSDERQSRDLDERLRSLVNRLDICLRNDFGMAPRPRISRARREQLMSLGLDRLNFKAPTVNWTEVFDLNDGDNDNDNRPPDLEQEVEQTEAEPALEQIPEPAISAAPVISGHDTGMRGDWTAITTSWTAITTSNPTNTH
jgi:hypothetical protein